MFAIRTACVKGNRLYTRRCVQARDLTMCVCYAVTVRSNYERYLQKPTVCFMLRSKLYSFLTTHCRSSCLYFVHLQHSGKNTTYLEHNVSVFSHKGGRHRNFTIAAATIAWHFYNKINQMHNISNLFYFGTTPYMFRKVFPSIFRSLKLYIQHHTTQVLWLLASKQPTNLYDIYLMLYVQS
jgi:hypothetical protein